MQSSDPNVFIKPLFDYFKSFNAISEELMNDYSAHCTPLLVKKNKFIISPLDHNAYLFFITSGLVRGFIRNNGKEITTRFSFEDEIIGAIMHPDGGETYSTEYLQALEDCNLIRIPYSLVEMAYAKYPEAHIIGRKLFAIQYYAASQRAILARIPNAADRYSMFITKGFDYIDRLPVKFQASYLGMRVETLSRIRSKLDLVSGGE
ncbi:Crp/Fnr family transcriptional regulator [Pedobacter agri]|uniref:Crp/Fnr family transcriptional regulator n=1 Tax=Pedobacter agri TaxID=454586 RepID=UPI002930D5FB|nr:Crp/Fnr family transcriptional regulator [Pedobacter agri]